MLHSLASIEQHMNSVFDRLFDTPPRCLRSPSKERSCFLCQETRFMQHSWYCRQMKILNASILFTIAASSNSNSKLSQSRDFQPLERDMTKTAIKSHVFPVFPLQSANRFLQLERFIS